MASVITYCPTILTTCGTDNTISVEDFLMAEGVNVRFTGELQRFIQERTGDTGVYASASEYIRDLVRHDYEREEQRKWLWLRHELKAGLEASESEFETLDIDNLIGEARSRRAARGS
jgi:antitoxin ParD1/3/4